jgi:hypothetical protein
MIPTNLFSVLAKLLILFTISHQEPIMFFSRAHSTTQVLVPKLNLDELNFSSLRWMNLDEQGTSPYVRTSLLSRCPRAFHPSKVSDIDPRAPKATPFDGN